MKPTASQPPPHQPDARPNHTIPDPGQRPGQRVDVEGTVPDLPPPLTSDEGNAGQGTGRDDPAGRSAAALGEVPPPQPIPPVPDQPIPAPERDPDEPGHHPPMDDPDEGPGIDMPPYRLPGNPQQPGVQRV